MRGATETRVAGKTVRLNFYSHTPCGVQHSARTHFKLSLDFYSHTPCGVQQLAFWIIENLNNFYSHTPCGVQPHLICIDYIITNFYSHTPCGVQHKTCGSPEHSFRFLLTHPLRGATTSASHSFFPCSFLLTHPLRGATSVSNIACPNIFISTHTPLAGCNRKIMYFTANCTPYNVGVDFFKNLY